MPIEVITVVFNNKNTIYDTIKSIQSQRLYAKKHLIIDGQSTDGTVEIIIRNINDDSINFISEPDNGIYDAMNKGINLAKGDIIGFLNADDIYENDAVLQTVQDAFDKDPALEIVYGDLLYVKHNDIKKIVRKWKTKTYYDSFFEDGLVPPHPSLFVKKTTLLESGGFDTKFKIAADYDLMFRLLKIESRKSQYIPQIFVRMRLGGESNSSVKNIKAGNIEIMKTWKKYQQNIPVKFWPQRYLRKFIQYLKF